MRIKKGILLILLLVGCSISTLGAQVSDKPAAKEVKATRNFTHVVKMGETAYSIATAYQTTVEKIYNLNPGSEGGIKVGEILTVPSLVNRVKTTQIEDEKSAFLKHKIEPKETLFSVSQKYNIAVGELLNANYGLTEATFTIGKEINIPDTNATATQVALTKQIVQAPSAIEHKVEKQETLYSISKKYDCSIVDIYNANPIVKERGLQEGLIIIIPQSGNPYTQYSDVNDEYNTNQSYYLLQDGIVRVALLLPFIEGSKNVSQEKITEYYEGFLLAIQRMKERGLNAEIFTFDIGSENDTRRLESILGTNELNGLNLIIGGVSDKQVQLISKFSKQTGIPYVVPFSNKNTGIESNKNLFQVANSHSNLFPKITRGFANKFKDYNIIFLTEMGSDTNKMDFVKELQKELKGANIPYTVAPTTASITDDLGGALQNGKKNIIIPTSSSESSLKRILEGVNVLARKGTDISLFGYPEWQTYINKTSKLHQVNAYIYGMFYLDSGSPDAQLFSDRYKKWYNKNLVISYPKFAYMGYDTGIVFLTALQKLGNDFSSRISELNTPTLQSALYFEPIDDKGGYINTGVYFVNLKPDNSVEKIEISKQ